MAENSTKIVISAEDRASGTLKGIGAHMGGLSGAAAAANAALASLSAGAALAGLAATAKAAIDAADNLNDLSQKTGIAIKDLVAYKLAAEQSGTSLDVVAKGMKALAVGMIENKDALTAAGITAKDTSGAMRQLAELFSQMPDGAEKAAIATKLLGKAGTDLIPLLNLGTKGLNDSAEASARYGAAMAALAPRADKFNDDMSALSLNMQAIGAELAQAVAPALNVLAEEMLAASKETTGLSTQASVLKTVFETVVVLGANVAYVLTGIGKEIGGVAAQMAALARFDFKGFVDIHRWMEEDAARARKEIDALSERLLNPPAMKSEQKSAPSDDLLRRLEELKKRLAGAGTASKTARDAYEELLTRLNAKDAGIDAGFFKDLQTLQAGFAKHGDLARHQAEVQKLVETQGYYKDALKATAKAEEDWQKSVEKARQAVDDEIRKLEERASAAEGELETYGKTKSEIEALIIARLEEQKAMTMGLDSQEELVANLEKEIAARKRARAAFAGVEAKDAAKKAAEDAARAWEDFARDIEQSLTDALMRSFEAGDDFGRAFAKNLENIFKTMILKFAIQATIGGAGQLLGIQTSAGATNAFSTAANLWSTGSGLYQGWTGLTTGGGQGAWGQAGNWLGNQLGTYPTAGGSLNASAVNYTNSMDLASDGAGSMSGSMAGLGYMAAFMAVGIALGEWLDSKAGGVKTEGDAFMTVGDDGPTFADRFVTGSDMFSGNTGVAFVDVNGNPAGETTSFYSEANGFTDYLYNTVTRRVSDQLTDLLTPFSGAVRDFIGELGGDASGLAFALGYSADAQGKAGVTLGSGVAGADGVQIYGGNKSVSGDLGAELNLELQRMLLASIKAADVSSLFKDALAGVDIAALDGEGIAKMFSNIGLLKQAFDQFEDLFPDQGGLTSGLLKAMGGMEAMQASLATYYDVAYSAEEKQAMLRRDLEDQFAALNVAMPDSVASLRALVEAQDLSTESGRALFAALIKLAPALAQVTDSASGLQDPVQAALAGVDRAVRAEKDRLQSAYEANIDSLDQRLAASGSRYDTLQSLAQTLTGALGGMGADSPLTLALRRQAQAQLGGMAAMARAGGVLPTPDALQPLLATLGRPAGDLYASRVDFLREQAQTRAALLGLSQVTDSALTIEEQTLAELKASREAAERGYREQVDTLDAQLAAARDQVDILAGIDKSVLSVRDAIAALEAAITGKKGAAAATAAKPTTATTGPASVFGPGGGAAPVAEFREQFNLLGTPYFRDVTDPTAISRYRDIAAYVREHYDPADPATVRSIAAAADQYDVSQRDIATALGVDPDYVRKIFEQAGIPAFAAGGDHLGGLRIVGERGPELEVVGPARIFNFDQMRGLLQGEDLAAELRAVRAELAALRAENGAENRSISAATAKTARLLDRVIPDGDALAVRTAA
jgi:ribosomal protein L29